MELNSKLKLLFYSVRMYIGFQLVLYLINFESCALNNFLLAIPWTLLWHFLTPCLCYSLYLQYSFFS